MTCVASVFRWHIIDLVVSQVRHYVFVCRGCKKRLWLPISFLSPLERNGRHRNKYIHTTLALLAAAALLTLLGLLLFAQGSPRVTGVDPLSGKVNDTVTVAGENLGKGAVSAVFLSDDKTDYKTTLVEQSEEKIVMKVPHVRPGRYNISVQTGNAIYIQPVRFTVQE